MKKFLLIFMFFFLASCAPQNTTPSPQPTPPAIQGTPLPRQMPADFQIIYKWTPGPILCWHLNKTTLTAGETKEEISFEPQSSPSPTWVENFSVDDTILSKFYETLYDAEVFDKEFTQFDEIAVGGHTESMIIIAYGNEYEIPYAFDDNGHEKEIRALYEEIRASVPQEIRDTLTEQENQYFAECEES